MLGDRRSEGGEAMSKLAHSNQKTMDLIEAKRIVKEAFPTAFAWKDWVGKWYVCNGHIHGDGFGFGKTEVAAWMCAARKLIPQPRVKRTAHG